MSRVQWNSSYNTETKTKERRSDPTKKEGLTEEEKDSSHSRSLFMKKLSVKTNWCNKKRETYCRSKDFSQSLNNERYQRDNRDDKWGEGSVINDIKMQKPTEAEP